MVANLLAEVYEGNFEAAVHTVLNRIEGSYSLVFLSKEQPDRLICAKKDNPLVIGLGKGENFIASDIPAIISKTRKTYILNDGEVAVVRADGVEVRNLQGERVDKKVFEVNWNAEAAEKGGYEHFMLKEIHEQPKAIRDTMSQRIAKDGKTIVMEELKWDKDFLDSVNKIAVVACGTAYHAGLVGKSYIEKLVRMPVEIDVASEFRYKDPIIDEKTLTIVVSQSGETSDTLAALKEAGRRGSRTLAITNVVGSSIAREADQVIYTWAGPEIAVASTKAYTTQLVAFFMLALYMAEIMGTQPAERITQLIDALRRLPDDVGRTFEDVDPLKTFARQYGFNEDAFFIGRSLDYNVAMEGSLKLKEISYIHAEAYAAGELKHGTLALIVEGVPVIALATQVNLPLPESVQAQLNSLHSSEPGDQPQWLKDANAQLAAMGSNVNVAGILSILGLVAAASIVGMYYATKCLNGEAWNFTGMSSGSNDTNTDGDNGSSDKSNKPTTTPTSEAPTSEASKPATGDK